MNDSDNFSKRLITRGKDLTKSSTGLSALLIFLTLLSLGIIFGLRFEPQPNYIIQEAISVGTDAQLSSNQDLNEVSSKPSIQPEVTQQGILKNRILNEDQAYANALGQQQLEIQGVISQSQTNGSQLQDKNEEVISTEVFDNYIEQRDINIEIQKSHASELTDLIKSQDQEVDPIMIDSQVVDVLDKQIEEREKIILEEETAMDELLVQTENGKLSESISNGHTQALIQEKSLEKSMQEYEESLESDSTLSEDEKTKILNALSSTASNFNKEREKRRDRLVEVNNQLSEGEVSLSQQENLQALMKKEDLEYANALRQQQMELDQMVDEEVTDQNIIKDSSNNYQLQKYQSEMLAKDIDGLLDELEEEKGVIFKPNSRIEELLAKDSDRSSAEEEIDDSNLILIDGLSDEVNKEEKERLTTKNNREKSQRKNLNNKKQVLIDRLSSSDNIDNGPMYTSGTNLVDKIDNVEQGLDLANQKIDLILNILSTNDPSQRAEMNSSAQQMINETQNQKKNNIQQNKTFPENTISDQNEKTEVIEQSLFTYDQVNIENREALEEQLEVEQIEFNNFKGSDSLSAALKKKSKWFISRATYRPKLTYPIEALNNDIEGDCLVSFQINLNGMTEDANANCTNDIFVSPTESTLEKYEFEPDEYINPIVEVVYDIKNY